MTGSPIKTACGGSDVDGVSVALSKDRAIDALVTRVLGWRTAPDRFIKPGRSWTPRSRFNPFVRLDDAFLLLDGAGGRYSLSAGAGKALKAEVRVGSRVGRASGQHKARTITRALCQALAIEVMRQ